MHWYILDDDNMPVPTGMKHAAAWMEFNTKRRQVAVDEPVEGVRVSTVFLCLDHGFSEEGPPVLWETMVFGGEHDGEQDRYTSHEEALAGHEAMLRRVSE